MVSMKEIAKQCNVSVATVSKALNGYSDIGEETKNYILRTASEMGYLPNSSARALKTKRTFNLGVLFVDEARSGLTHDYFNRVLESFKSTAEAKGYDITFTSGNVSGKRMTYLEHCRYRGVDGVVMACVDFTAEEVQELLLSDIPVVTIDHICDGRISVVSNNIQGMEELVTYIYKKGHRKIAYVGTLLAMESITDRYFGYQKALLELGLEQKKEWVLDDRHIETGKIDTVNMLQLPKDMPTAFVCNCDLTASFLIKKLKDNGYRVPEDISVVGFDNYLYPGLSDIQITTYEVDLKEMAKKAVYNMISKISNENYKPGIHIVEGHMVLKESVAQIPSGKA